VLRGAASTSLEHAYFGPAPRLTDTERALRARRDELDAAGVGPGRTLDPEDLCQRVARHLDAGHVVGWVQGRMEFGPRALGARSILGDPRRADMKEILNAKIKRRESFRPFAPAVLSERQAEWFASGARVPFMSRVFPVLEAKRGAIPAVVHQDGTGRLQTVEREAHPRFHRLIECFEARTGVPIVLNTSFNENEPVVFRPEEALDCFLRTRMDVLVLEDRLLERVALPELEPDAIGAALPNGRAAADAPSREASQDAR
jgi:carbamoyltransferase